MAVRLGIDASQPVASCAVSTGDGGMAELFMEKPIENFPTLIRDTLSLADVKLKDVEEIVVCVGPGSQTGVRAAVVMGNTLAFALGKPVSGVLSTDAGAATLIENWAIKVAVSAGRRRFFVEGYERDGGRLQRAGDLRLEDDLPEDAVFAFSREAAENGERSCAAGALLVAENERHLMEQASADEIAPFEFDGG